MAHICCSPPDSVPASCRRRSARIGKHRIDALQVRGDGGLVVAQIGAHQEIVAHAHGREQAAALRDVGDAGPDEIGRRRVRHRRCRRPTICRHWRAASPERQRNRVVLPAPFEPIRQTSSPAPTSSDTSHST